MSEQQTKRVRVSNGHHFGGMPSIKETSIRIESVSLNMNIDLYSELAQEIDKDVSKKLAEAKKVYDNYWNKVNETQALIKNIRSVFYDESDDYAFKRDKSEIDFDKLDEIIENSGKLFGFE